MNYLKMSINYPYPNPNPSPTQFIINITRLLVDFDAGSSIELSG